MKNLLKKLLGDRGERAAARYLKQKGYRVLQRGYRNRYGEIDLIAFDKPRFVFVEVKTRASNEFGRPFDAVDRQKQRKITSVALAWLKSTKRLDQPARFDVVSILWPDGSNKPQIEHIENAFEAVGTGQFYS